MLKPRSDTPTACDVGKIFTSSATSEGRKNDTKIVVCQIDDPCFAANFVFYRSDAALK
jgi:hypothetical protein